MDKLTDNHIVEKTLYENKEFFALLIERYEKKIRRYVRRISYLSDNDLDDILQEIFIKTYQNLHDYDKKLSFSSWIYRIAHNLTIDKYRKYKAKKRDFSIDIEDEVSANIKNNYESENLTENNFHREYIEKALLNLKEKYREVIILFYFEEKSYKEISDILKKPENTVATLLSRAKKRLRDEINKITNNSYEEYE
jgi:RNA polymerase sigma-70 factor (ECF subfamily)